MNMTEFFTIWVYIGIALIGLLLIGLFAAVVIQSRRGPTEKDRALAGITLRNMFWSTLTTGGLFLGGFNIQALVLYSPYDGVPVAVHIGLVVVGVALFAAGVIVALRDQAKARS